MPDGKPPAECGAMFVAIHQLNSRSLMDNALDERFGFAVTLTMRVTIPLDRIGEQELALNLAREVGFNFRVEALRAYLHMNWDVLGTANNYIVSWANENTEVYGFCEPARYRGAELPIIVGGDWFGADPGVPEDGLKSEMRFEDARRLQAIATFQ